MSDQVRHAMSYPYAGPCPAGPYPIQNSEFGNSKSGTPEARCMERYPSIMERYRRFRSHSASFRLTTEHGAVWCVPT